MKARVIVGMVALAAVAGCRNVDLPSSSALSGADGGFGRGPSVALNFAQNAAVALSAPLSFTADSLVGVASVSVSCGQVQLASWLNPPYQAQVDLSPCVPFGKATDAGAGILDLALVVSAADVNGNHTDVIFHLTVDARVPAITTDIPDRIRPGEPLDFTLTTSVAPGAIPTVSIADLPAELTPDPSDAGVFHGHLAKAPQIGLDALDGGALTLQALTEVERTVPVKADAVAPNGNRGRYSGQVLVSRVLWDRGVPGAVNGSGQNAHQIQAPDVPTAVPGHLVIPLAASLTQNNGFIPAVFAADSGSVTLDAPLIDGNWIGQALDESGWTIARTTLDINAPLAMVNSLQPSTSLLVGDAGVQLPSPSVQMAGRVCGLNYASCGFNAAELDCVGHATGYEAIGSYPYGLGGVNLPDGGSVETIAASSGNIFFEGGYQPCANTTSATPTYAIGSLDAGLVFASSTYTSSGFNCVYSQLYPVIPTGDGDFVFMPLGFCQNATGYTFEDAPSPVLLNSKGDTVGGYTLNSPWRYWGGIVTTFGPEHDLLTLQANNDGTRVSRFPADAGSGVLVATLPGAYAYPADQVGWSAKTGSSTSVGQDVITDADGVAILVATSSTSEALIRLGADLQPRWVYLYPRPVTAGQMHLYGADPNGPLYLVDSYDNRVVAIER